jgi:molybdate transport system substrate-binding protein
MASIRVMSGGAPKEVFAALTPKFAKLTGHEVTFVYAVIAALREKIAADETADIWVMPRPVLDGYAKEGKLRASVTFGIVRIALVVREGAPLPDISSLAKFRAALLAARSLVFATPGKTPSGTHMGKVMEQLGIAEAMADKITHRPALDGGVQMVAAGEAEMGIYPASEVAGIAGLSVAGTLPAGADLDIVYGGAVTAVSSVGDAAAAWLTFMTAPEHRSVWTAAGFTPAS